MSLITKLKSGEYMFYCVGCKCHHFVTDKWIIKLDEATITPSVLTHRANKPSERRCHSFITKGKIQYLQDCSHELAGKTVDMVEVE